jgi:hypothetical protein
LFWVLRLDVFLVWTLAATIQQVDVPPPTLLFLDHGDPCDLMTHEFF